MKVLEQKLENQKEELKRQSNVCYDLIIKYHMPALKKDFDKIVQRFNIAQLQTLYNLCYNTNNTCDLMMYIKILVV